MSEQTPQAGEKKRPELPLSVIMTSQQQAKLLQDAKQAKKEGRPVGWSTALNPAEIAEALDLVVLYPENESAGIAARHASEQYTQFSEGELNFPVDICSYPRINFALVKELQRTPIDEAAFVLPDYLILNNNSCGQVIYWYEILAKWLNIPILFLDTVYNYDAYNSADDMPDYKVVYLKKQVEELIAQMEKLAGKKMDPDRFLEAQKRTLTNRTMFEDMCTRYANKPAPASGFNLFNYMAAMVTCRPKESTTRILEQIDKEMDALIAAGKSQFPVEEKYRVFWMGIACWPHLRHNMAFMTSLGMNVVISPYAQGWSVEYDPGDLFTLSRTYSYTPGTNNNFSRLTQTQTETLNGFSVDGMIGHNNRSCKTIGYFLHDCTREQCDRACIPLAIFDGDQADERAYSKAQFETRIQGLAEVIDAQREAKK